MQFHRSLDTIQLSDSWMTIGSFDGVHLGHQSIISDMVSGAQAAGVPSVVLTFDPHPVRILKPDLNIPLLTSVEARAELFADLGVDHMIAYPFTDATSALSAEAFLTLLKNNTGFTRLFIGYDFAMGKDRSGDQASLAELGEKLGYTLQVFEPVTRGQEVFSSSRIRQLVLEGDVKSAAGMLGRPYSVSGRVVEGAQRGRLIGVPTANIAVPRGHAIPKTGVYACKVLVRGETYPAATNIGVRPTFEQDTTDETVEAHILDFKQNIYNEIVQVSFYERLRGEQKFSDVNALITQIRSDIVRAREVFDETVS